ncbi:MAG: YesL family protein [Lachnospiraceae bacterium]
MGNLFNYDNKFFQGFNKIIDCVVISALWLLFCVPVFTAGAATSAMYYTVHKVLRGGRGYVWINFWTGFKENFKQSTILWLIVSIASGLMMFNVFIMRQYLLNSGGALGLLFYVYIVLLLLLAIWSIYLFTYTSRFKNTIRNIIKNTAIIALLNLPYSFLFLVFLILSTAAIYLIPILVLLLPAMMMWILNYFMEKIYRKYMSEEDLAKEIELDKEIHL